MVNKISFYRIASNIQPHLYGTFYSSLNKTGSSQANEKKFIENLIDFYIAIHHNCMISEESLTSTGPWTFECDNVNHPVRSLTISQRQDRSFNYEITIAPSHQDYIPFLLWLINPTKPIDMAHLPTRTQELYKSIMAQVYTHLNPNAVTALQNMQMSYDQVLNNSFIPLTCACFHQEPEQKILQAAWQPSTEENTEIIIPYEGLTLTQTKKRHMSADGHLSTQNHCINAYFKVSDGQQAGRLAFVAYIKNYSNTISAVKACKDLEITSDSDEFENAAKEAMGQFLQKLVLQYPDQTQLLNEIRLAQAQHELPDGVKPGVMPEPKVVMGTPIEEVPDANTAGDTSKPTESGNDTGTIGGFSFFWPQSNYQGHNVAPGA